MSFDFILADLPFIGVFFERTYEFWGTHIAFANITHFGFGLGVGLVFTERRKVGFCLIVLGILVHVVAFLN